MAVLTQMGTEMPRKNHCPPSSPVSMGWVMWGQGDKPGAIHKLDKCSTKEPHPNPKRYWLLEKGTGKPDRVVQCGSSTLKAEAGKSKIQAVGLERWLSG